MIDTRNGQGKLTALATLIDGHTSNIYKSIISFVGQKKKNISHNLFKLRWLLLTTLIKMSWSKVEKYGSTSGLKEHVKVTTTFNHLSKVFKHC